MLAWLRRAFVLLLVFAPSMAFAQASSTELRGWWRADIEAYGDETSFYIRFCEVEGRPAVQATMPVVNIENLILGPYAVEGDTVRIPGLAWSLTLADGGAALTGRMPNGLVRHHEIDARFERSEPPTPLPPLEGAQAPPSPVWTTDLGSEVWAGLVHDPRRRQVYVGTDDGRVLALRARDGAPTWSSNLGASVRATPVLTGNRLLVVTDAALVALNPRNGRVLWRAPFGEERNERLPISDSHARWDHYGASPVIDGNDVLTASRDGCVRAHTLRDGAERWRYCTESILAAAPAVAEGRVFFGGFDGNAYAIARADGAELWRLPMRGEVTTAPLVAGGRVIFGSRSHVLSAHDPVTGAEAWRRLFWLSWVDSEPVVRDNVLYIGSSDLLAVQAFDLEGRRLWSSRVPGWSWARVAVGEGSVYAAVTGAREYFTPRQGALAAMDRQTGSLRWMIRAERPEDAYEYGFAASPALADRRLFAADLAGRVYAFDDPGA